MDAAGRAGASSSPNVNRAKTRRARPYRKNPTVVPPAGCTPIDDMILLLS